MPLPRIHLTIETQRAKGTADLQYYDDLEGRTRVLPQGERWRISTIFAGERPVFQSSTDDKDVREFLHQTNPDTFEGFDIHAESALYTFLDRLKREAYRGETASRVPEPVLQQLQEYDNAEPREQRTTRVQQGYRLDVELRLT
jgi:hypothetical protein